MATVTCPNCATSISDTSASCPLCGATTPLPPTPSDASAAAATPSSAAASAPPDHSAATSQAPDTAPDSDGESHSEARAAESEPDGGRVEEARRCREPSCEGTVPPDATACPYCNTPLRGWTVELPSGPIEVGRTLRVGRDPTWSPLGTDLTPYEDVSRRHAVLRVVDDELQVEDVGSSNGTYLDAVRVRPGEPRTLTGEGLLQLGRRLQLRIHRE